MFEGCVLEILCPRILVLARIFVRKTVVEETSAREKIVFVKTHAEGHHVKTYDLL